MWEFEQFAPRTAIVDAQGAAVTYAELKKEGDALAAAVGSRCLAFVLCKNEAASVIGYTAFINNRIVPVLLNAHMEDGLLQDLVRTYHPAYLWVPEEQKGQFASAREVMGLRGYVLLRTDWEQDYGLYPDLALLLTTSGSTGSPKFVRQSYDNIRANTESIIAYLGLDSTERAITTLPMNYTYGLSIINTHLMVGAALLMTEKGLMQKEFWQFFREQGATSFGGVPYTYEMLDRLRFYRMDLPSLRYMTQAGGKLAPELHRKMAEYAQAVGKRFVVMYGQCEATARMGYLPADKALEKCGSMGVVIPGGRFRLIDAAGNEIEQPDVTGELVYEGRNVTLGYAECAADLAKGDERGGVLCTGDMARMDKDGYYYIVGRKKRFLKIYGNRVNLDEIDMLIKGRFEGLDCASAGTDDHMYIFVTDSARADEVKNFVVGKTKLNPAAFQTVVIGKIPKNDAGKTLYKELAKYYERV